MPFSGFGPQAVPFFKALAFHQTKDWFEANRAIYEDEIKRPLGDLVEDLAARFAKAKTPPKDDPGMLYVHVAAEGCFMAAGFWQPEPEALARLRAAIGRAPKAWKTMVA